jgi:hypothetical protein
LVVVRPVAACQSVSEARQKSRMRSSTVRSPRRRQIEEERGCHLDLPPGRLGPRCSPQSRTMVRSPVPATTPSPGSLQRSPSPSSHDRAGTGPLSSGEISWITSGRLTVTDAAGSFSTDRGRPVKGGGAAVVGLPGHGPLACLGDLYLWAPFHASYSALNAALASSSDGAWP